jgi:hypothetical protein
MGLLEKFGGEQGAHHPGPLTWPGSGAGFPILGRVAPNLRQDEFEELDHRFTYHAAEFRSWVEEEKREYLYVQERIANGWFFPKQYERVRDAEGRGWVIWLEWVQTYGVLPPEMLESGGRDAVKSFLQRQDAAAFLAGAEVEVAPALVPGPGEAPRPAGIRPAVDPFARRPNGHA